MRIYLLRHGETPSNAARIVQTPDTPLSELGSQQAARLGERLANVGITSLLSSPLRRAMMTAEAIRGTTGLDIVVRADLQERNYGDIRGTPYDDLEVGILDPDYEPPGGETWREFHQRVDGAWSHIRKLVEDAAPESGDLAVVTHGLVLFSLVSRVLDLSQSGVAPVGFQNTSVTLVEGEEPWTVTTLDCVTHLEQPACPSEQDPQV